MSVFGSSVLATICARVHAGARFLAALPCLAPASGVTTACPVQLIPIHQST